MKFTATVKTEDGEWVKAEIAVALYKALLNILSLKAADNYDEELWTKAWAKGVDALRVANGEKSEGGGEGE